jgi:hypothetical protein
MKQYFITISENQAKNNLQKSLQGSFGIFAHKLINEPDICLLKQIYLEALEAYKANKGRSHVDFSESNYGHVIYISMGDSLILNLTLVTGTIKNHKPLNS